MRELPPWIPKDAKWVPHYPHTWPWRYGKLKKDVIMEWYQGYWAKDEKTGEHGPVMVPEEVKAGTKVKIVMVSRFGDIGITNKLDTDVGYGARVEFEDIERIDDVENTVSENK